MITTERKQEIIKEFARSENDTGSPEVQIAVLTERIQSLTDHMKGHHGDHSSRMGLLKLVNRRNRLLKYLRTNHMNRYREIISRLGLRK